MAETVERNQRVWTIVAVFGLPVVALLYGWPWLYAWFTFPDLTEQDRTAFFQEALRHGVAARLEKGRMVKLGRGDVAEVGASTCVRDTECSRSSRRGCREVLVTFTCTYPVKHRAGGAATAV